MPNNRAITIMPIQIIKRLADRLLLLIVAFFASMVAGDALNLDESVIDALQQAGTLTLGSYLTLIKDKLKEDRDGDGIPDIFQNTELLNHMCAGDDNFKNVIKENLAKHLKK